MSIYHNPGLPGNGKPLPASGLPLFDYAASRITADPLAVTLPRAAQIIARRHALSPHIARLFAEHAGFNLEASE